MKRRRVIQSIASLGAAALPILAPVSTPVSQQKMSARTAGFRQPLESVPHERTFMQWPARPSIYGGNHGLEAVRRSIALIAATVAAFEPVVMLVRPEQIMGARLALAPGINLWPMDVEDLWCRDTGPTFVRSPTGELAVTDLNFNGWGGRQSSKDDGRIAAQVAQKLGLPVYNNRIVGEGGGVECDGAGTLLAHESSWINANRNKQTKPQIERLLLDALGGDNIIWAPGVKGADITDFHIDALARWVKPGQILVQLPAQRGRTDRWSVAAFKTHDIIKQYRDSSGRALDIVVIHEPDSNQIRSRSKDFVASYVNYYVCNGAVVVAEFGDQTADQAAHRQLQQLYPNRKLVSLNIDPIGEAGGGIHCTTQQQPATVL